MSNIPIIINGENKEVKTGTTLKEILDENDVNIEAAVTKVNGETVEKEEIGDFILNENDEVEYIYFMGGGN